MGGDKLKSMLAKWQEGKEEKTSTVVRVNNEQYNTICGDIEAKCEENGVTFFFARQFRDKTSHGDVDVYYSTPFDVELLREWFHPVVMETQGHMSTFAYQVAENEYVQVDFIRVFLPGVSQFYYSFADVGMCLGMMAHHANLKFNDCGLFLKLTGVEINALALSPTLLATDEKHEFLLTNNLEEIVSFFGLDFAAWERGFDCKQDAFVWLSCCNLFYPQHFITGEAKLKRHEKPKRPFMHEFEEFCKDQASKWLFTNPSTSHTTHLDTRIVQEIRELLEYKQRVQERNAKFNGKIIMELGFNQGKQIGMVMNRFRQHICDTKDKKFDDWLDETSAECVLENIVAFCSTCCLQSIQQAKKVQGETKQHTRQKSKTMEQATTATTAQVDKRKEKRVQEKRAQEKGVTRVAKPKEKEPKEKKQDNNQDKDNNQKDQDNNEEEQEAQEMSDSFFQLQHKTDKELILSNPDTHVGSAKLATIHQWILEPTIPYSSLFALEKSQDKKRKKTKTTQEDKQSGWEKQEEKEQEVGQDKEKEQEDGQDKEREQDEEKEEKDQEKLQIVEKEIEIVPALLKLFDEAIVNCRDHAVRMEQYIADGKANTMNVTFIAVTIDPATGTISMQNDGNGMDVQLDPVSNLYMPELAYAHLRHSTNYNKAEEKIVGGKNGYGIKLVFIWSTYGSIEIVDHLRQLKYVQHFHNNLDRIDPPVVTQVKAPRTKDKQVKPYTKITFTPDYERLGISLPLHADIVGLFQRRVFDIAAITNKTVKVTCNGVNVSTASSFSSASLNFDKYASLFLDPTTPRIYEKNASGRWEYVISLIPDSAEDYQFKHVSFVNGIHTCKGGTHIDHVMTQLCRRLQDLIQEKKKTQVATSIIKNRLMLFLRCDIINPDFDSQSKEFMTTPVNKFGSTCVIPDKVVETIATKFGIMNAVCDVANAKEKQKISKKTDGSKRKDVIVPKLVDANWAGTAKSHLCTLILTEGDSAKSGVISGLSQEDRNNIGVFPLKGKLMNVRDKSAADVGKNEEITNLKKILGIESSRQYKTLEDVQKYLRYGRVAILTDQDLDGSHIKGLTINLFHAEWKTLTQLTGFICFMNTPILIATPLSVNQKSKDDGSITFYNQGEYDKWKLETPENVQRKYSIQYFKGLGTSTKQQWLGYMKEQKYVEFEHQGETCDESIDIAFNKKRADDRKQWLLEKYNPTSYADTSLKQISYSEFFEKEFIHFSNYDNERNIPSFVDGLKLGQRKIMFSIFKKNQTKPIKVASLCGYVTEQSGYHHGEASLQTTIINMAQNFVGSNNINLLVPAGQFGTRLSGGDDAASPRYIFTHLEPIARKLFCPQDDAVITYNFDDGSQVEPTNYVPILPLLLVNGANGIGSGYSTFIPSYNPMDIVALLKRKIARQQDNEEEDDEQQDDIPLLPFYEGFKGTITAQNYVRKQDEQTYIQYTVRGNYVIQGSRVVITELPVGTWTESYMEYVNKLYTGVPGPKPIEPVLSEVPVNLSTDSAIHITVTFINNKSGEPLDPAMVEKVLKLTTTFTTSNMYAFNAENKLRKFSSPNEIVDAFIPIRLETYRKRKAHMLAELRQKQIIADNKARYIQENIRGSIDMRNKPISEINALLEEKGYYKEEEGGYGYLTDLPMSNLCKEKVEKLLQHLEKCNQDIAELEATSECQLWLNDLNDFEHEYKTQYLVKRYENDNNTLNGSMSTTVKSKAKVKKVITTSLAGATTALKKKATTELEDGPKKKGKATNDM